MLNRLDNTSACWKGRVLAVLLVNTAIAVPLLLIACMPYNLMSDYEERSFDSNGERIYFTAENASGEQIINSGGAFMMRGRVASASCHAPGGEGGRVRMMMWGFSAPSITWNTLTQQEGHEEDPGEDEHEEHPPYSEETLKRAITEGFDPAGEPLRAEMPRWRMSEQDLEDLIAFMKTL